MASDILIVATSRTFAKWCPVSFPTRGMKRARPHDSDSALAASSTECRGLIFLDIWMQGSKLDGLALLDEIKARHPDIPVVRFRATCNIETAVSPSTGAPMTSSKSPSRRTGDPGRRACAREFAAAQGR